MLQTVTGQTFHKRIGGPDNAFRYGVDFVLTEPDRNASGPALFSRNKRNVVALHDRDNGGKPGQGAGVSWARQVIADYGLDTLRDARILLLTQPRVLGYLFNPVSFWFVVDGDETLRAVIAEVSNTFGDRHSYLCHHDDLRPIGPDDIVSARKIFHVSPFQPVEGNYRFRFDIRDDLVGVWIDFATAKGGLNATLTGSRKPHKMLTHMIRPRQT